MRVVVQKTVNKLKNRPEDERKVVAGGVAAFVMVILFIVWAVYFFRQIQSGVVHPSLDSGIQDQFNPSTITNASKQLQQLYQNGMGNGNSELNDLRNSAAQSQIGSVQQMQVQQQQSGTDQFGNSNTAN